MKLHFGRLLTMAWYCQHLLVRGVSGKGGQEEEQLVRPSAEWLDEFYSNVDNVLTEARLTPKASDLATPVYEEWKPANELPPEMDNGRKLQPLGIDILYKQQGVTFKGLSPPDPVGDVGTKHYVQMTNTIGHSGSGSFVRILNKNDGSLNKVFVLGGLGTGNCTFGRGDPIVLFDQLASRWLLSELSRFGNSLCVYISTSDDATGTYIGYEFPTPGFPTYPKFGVWNDAYYIGTSEITPTVYALERNQMLTGDPARIVRNSGPHRLFGFGNFQMIPPVDADGNTPPPAGPGLFVRHVDDEAHLNYVDNPASDLFEIWTLKVDFDNLKATLALIQNIQVDDFDSTLVCDLNPKTKTNCGVPQLNPNPNPNMDELILRLDPLREVVMNRPQYRNFGTHETILATWVTVIGAGVDRSHAVRWMELRKAAGASAWVVHQQNNYSPDATSRWMSSGAMNGNGDIAIGYSVSDSVSVFPGIRVTGRLSTDPLNQLDAAEVTFVDGFGPSNSTNLWGGSSSMVVDPIDDFTFWYTGEFIPIPTGQWSTHITKFTL